MHAATRIFNLWSLAISLGRILVIALKSIRRVSMLQRFPIFEGMVPVRGFNPFDNVFKLDDKFPID